MQAKLAELWASRHLPFSNEPKFIREFDKGLSNTTFLIQADGEYFVAQDKKTASHYPGLDPVRELQILQQVSESGLAPAIIYHSLENNILITEHIDGRHWQKNDAKNEELVHKLLKCIQQLHEVKSDLEAFNYLSHIEAYLQILENQHIHIDKSLIQQQRELLTGLNKTAYTAMLSHHDLNTENILITQDKLFFLDWEYAAPGWPLFDFAAITTECGISGAQIVELFSFDKQEFELAQLLYQHLCHLWQLVFRHK